MRLFALGLGALSILVVGGVAVSRPVAGAAERFVEPPWDAELDQRPLPRAELEAWLERRAQDFAARNAFLAADRELFSVTFEELGLALDVPATAAEIRRLPRPTGVGARLRRAFFGPPRELRRVTPVIRFDAERARSLLERRTAELEWKPENARLDLREHRRVPERAGRALRVNESVAAIAGGERAEGSVFELSFERFPAQVALSSLPAVDVSRVLSRYETDFTGRGGARAVNIRRAAGLLERYVLAPGQKFSFNRVVGARSEERGFVKAPVIVNDETEPGLGGGVCQVATTLHAAAVLAGLVVSERRSHSRASGYAPLGLDATVIEGKVDLRLENPFEVPLMFHAFLPSAQRIRVEILGRSPPARAEHAYHVVERYPFARRVVEREGIPSGSFERKQKGSYGYDVVSLVTLAEADGKVATRHYKSKYYPVPEVFWIGAGTDRNVLPPLPDGATGVEEAPAAKP
jgi:vancomycin resistance protein YoaR